MQKNRERAKMQKGIGKFPIPNMLEIKQSQLLERLVSFSSMCTGTRPKVMMSAMAVAAQTVRTMDTACGLTGSIKTWDNLTVGVKNLSLGVDFQSAHGVVNSRNLLAGVPRTFSHLLVSLVVGDEASGSLYVPATTPL